MPQEYLYHHHAERDDYNHEERIQVFDRAQEFAVVERRLPHWAQVGTICFITWRTWDSIPAPVLDKWLAERDAWLARHVD